MGIVETIRRSESVFVLHHRFWTLGRVSCLGPLGLRLGGTCMSLDSL
jgi:hypothetical protein